MAVIRDSPTTNSGRTSLYRLVRPLDDERIRIAPSGTDICPHKPNVAAHWPHRLALTYGFRNPWTYVSSCRAVRWM